MNPTKNLHFRPSSTLDTTSQRGNAMIYVLIAVALLGFLTIMLSRSNDSGSQEDLSPELLQLKVADLLKYPLAAQNTLDQMIISGSETSDLDFTFPDGASFDTAPYYQKVFHPDGGGLNRDIPDPDIFTGTDTDPDPGWYLGRFNNVDWTPSATNDVILVAHQISKSACEQINKKITGSTTIPAIAGTGNLADYLIDDALHTGTNAGFTTAVCASCDGVPALCVSNTAANMWSYYNILEAE